MQEGVLNFSRSMLNFIGIRHLNTTPNNGKNILERGKQHDANISKMGGIFFKTTGDAFSAY